MKAHQIHSAKKEGLAAIDYAAKYKCSVAEALQDVLSEGPFTKEYALVACEAAGINPGIDACYLGGPDKLVDVFSKWIDRNAEDIDAVNTYEREQYDN